MAKLKLKFKSKKSEEPKKTKKAAKAKSADKAPVKASKTPKMKPPTKKAKKGAKPKAKKSLSKMTSAADMSADVKKQIKAIDALEKEIESLGVKKMKELEKLVELNGSNSFEHPVHGPYCVMRRENKEGKGLKGFTVWWRAKPRGHVAA